VTTRTTTYVQRLNVPFAYPVVFTHALFDPANPVFARTLRRGGRGPHRLLVCADDGVLAAHPALPGNLQRYLERHAGLGVPAHAALTVPGGERAKNGWNTVREIMAAIGSAHLDRHSFVVAIGGGSVLDMVGFAAALVHRGIRLIRVPTSVLAQADAGVGVKNGMDEHGLKNYVGTFAPPFAVLNDFDFLATLPRRYWTGGLAEAFKVALIKDARLYALLCRRGQALRARDEAVMARIVARTARLHLAHIRAGGDPFEMGSARPLDFGHWAGHKLELLSHHRLSHGEAVAIGIALDVCYAATQQMLTAQERDGILAAMRAVGLPLWDEAADSEAPNGGPLLLQGLEEFREHLGGRLTLTLPRGIGHGVEVHRIDAEAMLAALRWLRGIGQSSGVKGGE
jgi:3-dehydroquinate synthase